MKEWEKIINKQDRSQNTLAFIYLLEYGKKNLLDDSFFKDIKDHFIEKEKKEKTPIFTAEYLCDTFDIARKMANLSPKDLQDYIYNDVKFTKKQERGR